MRFAVCLAVACAFESTSPILAADDDAKALKVLDRFVGAWEAEVVNKPSKSMPMGGSHKSIELTRRLLKDRCIAAHVVESESGRKSLSITTYDPETRSYPFWFFNSAGIPGGEWNCEWDGKDTFTSKATNTPKGWTSLGTTRFTKPDACEARFWMKDDAGTMMFDLEAKKTKKPDENGQRVLEAWSKNGNPARPLPEELKLLDRLAGSWDAVAISKPAVWTPKEVKVTSKVTRNWILDGWFLQDTSEASDGIESYSLTTFDPNRKQYLGWWFNSEGHRNKSAGEWDAATETLTLTATLKDGLTVRSILRFTDANRHVWTVDVKDGDGKVYFDTEWTVTRRK